jgi:hypothetical protein
VSANQSIIERRLVDSTCVSSIGYSAIEQALEIEFRSGLVYRYQTVPEHVHENFIAADSKGAHFNRFIKGRFAYVKVDDEE